MARPRRRWTTRSSLGAAEPLEESTTVEGAFAVAGGTSILEPASIEWTVPADPPDEAWSLEALGVLGLGLTLTLRTADGTSLATAVQRRTGACRDAGPHP